MVEGNAYPHERPRLLTTIRCATFLPLEYYGSAGAAQPDEIHSSHAFGQRALPLRGKEQ